MHPNPSRSAAGEAKKKVSMRPRSFSAFSAKLNANKSADWSRVQKAHLSLLFKRMSLGVPAYRRFIHSSGARRAQFRIPRDFTSVPVMSKANYLKKNAFQDLFWDGSLRTPQVLTSTSGSTGKPTYFARSFEVDERSSFIHELIFRTSSLKEDKSTLVIVCFGMGVWIGGLITYQAFELMGRRGYPISVITPGINKAEIIKALTDIAPHY